MNKRRFLAELASDGLLQEEKSRGISVPKYYRVKGRSNRKVAVEWNSFVSTALNMGGSYE